MAFKRILITGGAGFIGVHAIDAFLARGCRVRVLDNFLCSSKSTLKPVWNKIELIEGDVRNSKDVKRAVTGADAVFHLAAIRSVVKTVEDPLLSHDVNATGVLLVLDHSRRAGVRHFVFTSTSAVYGRASSGLQREEGLLEPLSPYGAAKLAAEHYARHYYFEKGLPTTSVRIFNVYGPRQNPESRYSLVVPAVLKKILNGEPPVINGSGEQARDFIYIGDVLGAFFKILGNRKAYGKVYNLGFGKSTSIRLLVKTLLGLAGSDLKAVHGPRRPADPDRTCADVTKIRRELGWRPKVGLREGLRRTFEWAESNGL